MQVVLLRLRLQPAQSASVNTCSSELSPSCGNQNPLSLMPFMNRAQRLSRSHEAFAGVFMSIVSHRIACCVGGMSCDAYSSNEVLLRYYVVCSSSSNSSKSSSCGRSCSVVGVATGLQSVKLRLSSAFSRYLSFGLMNLPWGKMSRPRCRNV